MLRVCTFSNAVITDLLKWLIMATELAMLLLNILIIANKSH